jgi:putative transposase
LSHASSPSTGRPYGVAFVCRALELSRATHYRRLGAKTSESARARRGPRALVSDEALLEEIRKVLAASLFVGEGHRKVWAKLRMAGVRTSRRRVLRLMREANLLAPGKPRRVLGPWVHDGTIVTELPNQMWGTDATGTWTLEEGLVTVFVAIDHCTAEAVGIHAAKVGTRYEALEPLRQGVRERFGAIGEGAAKGLKLRHDHGSQFMSDAFQEEVRFWGMESSPAFVRAPEGNGCAERFIRTLKEQLLWVRTFRNAEELRLALLEWIQLYNRSWLVERHGYLTPEQARRQLEAKCQAA